MLLTLLALACSDVDLEALQSDLNDLDDQVDALEDELDDLNAQLADTGDTGPVDTGEPPPEPGEVTLQVNLATEGWTFGVELSESADVELFVTWTTAEEPFSVSWSDVTCEAVLHDGNRYYWNHTHAVAEISWANGATSCVQVVDSEAQPIADCDVVQPRAVSCE